MSGIDGSGKGWTIERVAATLVSAGLRVAPIGIDGWLNLPDRRFNSTNPAERFYAQALRFDEMFAQPVLPLRDNRSLKLEADLAYETATAYHKHVYDYRDIDVILLEGIYLLKRELTAYYDLSIWLDCTFETALERAIARTQEGLSPDETINAYNTIYFPAQKIHFERDHPQEAATMLMVNDPRLGRTLVKP